MTKQQIAAARQLEKALDNCHKHGLRGGVYEYSFRVWPSDGPNPQDAGLKFFDAINEYGRTINSYMILDGGAGV